MYPVGTGAALAALAKAGLAKKDAGVSTRAVPRFIFSEVSSVSSVSAVLRPEATMAAETVLAATEEV